jgi:hypothetical protein
LKIVSRILYYLVLWIIILYAFNTVLQKAVVSPVLRKYLTEKAAPALKADRIEIDKISLSLNKLSLKNIVYENDSAKILFKDIMISFSPWNTVKNLFTLRGWIIEAESVDVDGCAIIISHQSKRSSPSDWKFDYNDFKGIISFLNENRIVSSVTLKEISVSYLIGAGYPVINGMGGKAGYSEDGTTIDIDLAGRFLNSDENNLVLKGTIDKAGYSSSIDLNFGGNENISINSPFGAYKIEKGGYEGRATLEINKNSDEKMYLSGNFNLTDIDASFGDRVYLSGANLDLSYFNGLVSVNGFRGRLNGLEFSGKGKINDLLNPEGDIFFDIEKAGGAEISSALKIAGIKDEVLKNYQAGDDNSLELYVSGRMFEPKIDCRLKMGLFSMNGEVIENINLRFRYSGDEVTLTEAVASGWNNVISASGKMTGIFSRSPHYTLDFKSTGAIFRNITYPGTRYLQQLSTITEGRMFGKIGEMPVIEAQLKAYDFKKSLNIAVFNAGMSLKKGILSVNVKNPASQKTISGNYNTVTGEYSAAGTDLAGFYSLLTGEDMPEKTGGLYFELEGDRTELLVKTGSEDPLSLFYGGLDAKFDLTKDVLESFVNWMPFEKSMVSRPANFRLSKKNGTITLSDIIYDSKEIYGYISLNIDDKTISGDIEASGTDLGKFLGIKGLKTNTDFVLTAKGRMSDPRFGLYMNENLLRYKDGENDSISVSGEAELHYYSGNVRAEKIILSKGAEKIMTVSGYLRNFSGIDLSAYGNIEASFLNPFLDGISLAGDIGYNMDLTGRLDDIRLKNSDIEFSDGSINKDPIKKIILQTTEFDSTGVLVKKLFVDAGKYLNLTAEGFLPYSDESEVYVTGEFYGDLISYLDRKTKLISKGYSECEGKFTLDGKFRKPKIKEVELYINDGGFKPKGSTEGFSGIRSKIYIDGDSNMDIVKFKMSSTLTGGSMTIENVRGDKKYGDIRLPGGINAGHLTILMDEKGVDYHAFNMMLPKDYGNFVLKGKDDEKFKIHIRNGNIVLDGRVYLRNSRITYPFVKQMKEESVNGNSEPADLSNIIFSDLELDFEVIPAGGNTYFYNLDSEEKTIWGRFVRSFTRLDNELSNVSVNVTPSQKGLLIQGPVGRPEKITIAGEVSGKNGTCNYSAFTFRIENVAISFDGGKNARGFMDPYLKASAKTTIKTKTDSLGFSDYETVYLKIVTKEDDEVTDYEGARISGISIILTDEFGNQWLDRDDKIKEIDTKETAKQLFVEAVDTRFLSPFISPIETALGRFLGASVSIRPNISGNFIDRQMGYIELPDSYMEYFLGSEFYISKSLTDNLALTWNSKYIGSEEYSEITERIYGYKNSLSFDYRLNNYIYSSAGYQYESLKDEYGYNLAVFYRYRFMNISEPYNYLKNLFRMR